MNRMDKIQYGGLIPKWPYISDRMDWIDRKRTLKTLSGQRYAKVPERLQILLMSILREIFHKNRPNLNGWKTLIPDLVVRFVIGGIPSTSFFYSFHYVYNKK